MKSLDTQAKRRAETQQKRCYSIYHNQLGPRPRQRLEALKSIKPKTANKGQIKLKRFCATASLPVGLTANKVKQIQNWLLLDLIQELGVSSQPGILGGQSLFNGGQSKKEGEL